MADIRQLRYFIALGETLHYGRAAQRLHISQPPLSRQIAALEKELEVKLVERNSQRTALTSAGQRFLQDATTVVNTFEQACRNVRLAGKGELGELSVGFMMHAVYSTVPDLTRCMLTKYPQVKLTLHEVTPGALVDEVLQGTYDVGLIFNPGPVKGLESVALYHEKLCLAIHASHRLSLKKRINAADLRDEALIATPRNVAPRLRVAIDEYCRRSGTEPFIRLETQLQQTIISLVAKNLGIALVPQSVSRSGYNEVLYREIENSPDIEQVLIWRADNRNPVLESFLLEAKNLNFNSGYI